MPLNGPRHNTNRPIHPNPHTPQVSGQDLENHMSEAGEVVRADVMIEPKTGRSKGCGTVEYRTPTQVPC